MTNDDIKEMLRRRAAIRLAPLATIGLKSVECWVAGGALIRDGNDVDLFIAGGVWPAEVLSLKNESVSKNAITAMIGGIPFQFCSYTKPTLAALVAAFDFAHCQIGCSVKIHGEYLVVGNVEWTKDFEAGRISGSSWYIKSEYPLSSLVRVAKYHKTGLLSRGEAMRATIDALHDVVKRGFRGYEDFKDQLDAVDLGLVPDDLAGVESTKLTDLFALLDKGKAANVEAQP